MSQDTPAVAAAAPDVDAIGPREMTERQIWTAVVAEVNALRGLGADLTDLRRQYNGLAAHTLQLHLRVEYLKAMLQQEITPPPPTKPKRRPAAKKRQKRRR